MYSILNHLASSSLVYKMNISKDKFSIYCLNTWMLGYEYKLIIKLRSTTIFIKVKKVDMDTYVHI